MIETITPAKARSYLKLNVGNRPVDRDRVDSIATLMRRGTWKPKHGIGFTNGILTDGQHRLLGIVKSGQTVKLKVARKTLKRNPPPPPVFGSLRKAVGAKRVEKIPRVRSVHDGKEGTVVRELQGGWLKIKLDDLNKHVLAAPGEYARTNPRTKKVIIIKIQNGVLSRIGGAVKRARVRGRAVRAFRGELRASDRHAAAVRKRKEAERAARENPNRKATVHVGYPVYSTALSALRKFGKKSAFTKVRAAGIRAGLSLQRIVKDARSALAKGRPKGARRNPSTVYQVRINPLAQDATHQIEVSHHFRGGGKSFRQRVIEAGQMDFWGESGNNRAINPKRARKRNPIPFAGDIVGGLAGGAGYVVASHALTKWLEKKKNTVVTRKPTKAIAKLHSDFQGRPTSGQIVLQTMPGTPTHLAQLGGLHEIKLINGQVLKFNSQRVRLCADGRQRLHVAGLRYKVNGNANPRIQRNLGKVESVTYYTRKNHVGRGKPFLYVHGLGEEGGAKPNLLLVNGYLKFKGGSYYIKPEGIRD